jgi:predicted alpha/beta-hydrolase family hydrolase
MPDILTNPGAGAAHILLAHGAGAPMDSTFMEQFAAALADGETGLTVHRFEFAYMAQRRTGGSKRPPPRMDVLAEEFGAAVAAIQDKLPEAAKLLIGGKSMGGRVASLIADAAFADGQISGLACAGYPFHPQGKPEQLRTEHLADMRCPTLILQGERDAFGNRDEVAGYALSEAIEVTWLTDGDHDFGPRGRSGATKRGNIADAARAVQAFAAKLTA